MINNAPHTVTIDYVRVEGGFPIFLNNWSMLYLYKGELIDIGSDKEKRKGHSAGTKMYGTEQK